MLLVSSFLIHTMTVLKFLWILQIFLEITVNKYTNKSLLDKILDENDTDMPKVVLTNGALLEIEAFCQKRNLEWKHLSRIVLILSNVCDPSHITADFLQHHISALQKKKNYIVGKKLKNN